MSEVTQILHALAQGDPAAADHLLPLVYDELRKLAAYRLAHQTPGQTLQPTALVHEAYLRLALDEALTKLATTDPQAAQLVQLRYFAGLSIPEAAKTLGVSPRTADRLWAFARVWLLREISGDAPDNQTS